MDEEEFWSYVYDKRDSRIWEKSENNNWILKDCISNYDHVDNHEITKLQTIDKCEYRLTNRTEDDTEIDKYLLMGRNYIDKYNFGSIEDRPKGYSNFQGEWKK